MPSALHARPDVLVLGGGGILGEAWMSAVLTGLAEADGWDPRDCRGFLGTSAGSIVATALVAGIAPGDRLGELGALGADATAGAAPPADIPPAGPRGSVEQALAAAAGLGGAVAAPLVSLALGSAPLISSTPSGSFLTGPSGTTAKSPLGGGVSGGRVCAPATAAQRNVSCRTVRRNMFLLFPWAGR